MDAEGGDDLPHLVELERLDDRYHQLHGTGPRAWALSRRGKANIWRPRGPPVALISRTVPTRRRGEERFSFKGFEGSPGALPVPDAGKNANYFGTQ